MPLTFQSWMPKCPQDIRLWAGWALLSIMATVPALPVILLPPTICLALQVLYTHTPALCLGIWGPCQAREIQDMAPLGQEGGPLRPIWPRLGREMRRRRKGRQTGTKAYWYHCSAFMSDNSQGALSGPPKSVLECSADLLLYHSHTLTDYVLLCMSSSTFSIFEHSVLAERPLN